VVNHSKKIRNLFENELEEDEPFLLCGIDEAGRGPLAGPLVVAGVILLRRINGLKDSKKLGQQERERLYDRIVERSRYHLVIVDAAEIDDHGISWCLRKALEEIVKVLGAPEVRFLFDGNSRYGVPGIATMIKADGKVKAVSAASILAKVTRDRIMEELAQAYPEYGFEHHKGYGTTQHLEAIERYGYTPIHRRSFHVKKFLDSPTLFEI
jgi:ribonuclease HII